jgi:hypothetical protein
MAIKRLNTRPRKALSSEQKAAFALLMFLGLGGVYFGSRSFGANLMRPIQAQIAEFYSGEGFLTQEKRESEALEASKVTDTDGDGLVDYDELYVYQTSPYLTDSDSDGYDDEQEVFSGNDPNCPMGRKCGVIVTSEGANTNRSDLDGLLEGAGTSVEELTSGQIQFDSIGDIEAFFAQMTLDQVRSALLTSGMSQDELDLVDDETLEAYLSGALDELVEAGAFDEEVPLEE